MNLSPDVLARIQPLMDHLDEEKARLEENFKASGKVTPEDELDLLLSYERQKVVYQVIDALFQSPDGLGHRAIMELTNPISIMRMLMLGKIK